MLLQSVMRQLRRTVFFYYKLNVCFTVAHHMFRAGGGGGENHCQVKVVKNITGRQSVLIFKDISY